MVGKRLKRPLPPVRTLVSTVALSVPPVNRIILAPKHNSHRECSVAHPPPRFHQTGDRAPFLSGAFTLQT